MALIAGILFLTPLLRAIPIAYRLPGELSNAFGAVAPHEGPRVPATIQKETRTFSSEDGTPLAMDIYTEGKDARESPMVLVIHGGSWQSGDKGELSALNRYLAARGYVVASMNYRLAPRWQFPAARDDVFHAIRFLKQHAQEIGWNGRQIVLLGRSAGGQIALSAAYAERDPVIRGVIAFYAPSDLVFGYAHPSNPLILNSRQVLESYLGGPPGRVAGLYEAASPLNFVNAWTPPTLLIHGGRDELVSPLHDVRLSSRLTEVHRPYLYLALPWATHGCDAILRGPSGQLSTYAIERFLSAVMPPI